MTLYRITLTKYANRLFAPGTAGRWNSQGRFVIYTAGSAALACLENLVHRDAALLMAPYQLMNIEARETVSIMTLEEANLPENWWDKLLVTRKIGDDWIQSLQSCILKVPSAIIQQEYNFLLNPAHPHFDLIKLASVQDFRFDRRLKSQSA
jgi:RES domain-containing protein